MVPVNESESQLAELREQAKALEEEVVALRRRLQDAPKRVRTLEERLLETKGQLPELSQLGLGLVDGDHLRACGSIRRGPYTWDFHSIRHGAR